MKNNKTKTPKEISYNKEQQVKNKKKLSDKRTEINIQQIDNKKFRHRKAVKLQQKNDGSVILKTNPYTFIYKENCIMFLYDTKNVFFFHANGISPILNSHVHEIAKVFPSVKIKIGVNNDFHFTNPKFYNYITNLVEEIIQRTEQDEFNAHNVMQEVSNSNSEKTELNSQILKAENIEFFDYYYKIWVVNEHKIKN